MIGTRRAGEPADKGENQINTPEMIAETMRLAAYAAALARGRAALCPQAVQAVS